MAVLLALSNPTPLLSAASNATDTSTPVLNPDMSFSAVVGLLFLAAAVVMVPVVLAWVSRKAPDPSDSAGKRMIGFFQIPYMTWFLLHLVIASIGIIAVVILGIDNIIDKGTVAALLGSLFGYVLGTVSAARNAAEQGTSSAAGANLPTITKVDTDTGVVPGVVTLVGTNFDQVTAVTLGNVAVNVAAGAAVPPSMKVISPEVMRVSVPLPAPLPAAAPIILKLASGATLTTTTSYP